MGNVSLKVLEFFVQKRVRTLSSKRGKEKFAGSFK